MTETRIDWTIRALEEIYTFGVIKADPASAPSIADLLARKLTVKAPGFGYTLTTAGLRAIGAA